MADSHAALPSDAWVRAYHFFNESRDFLLAWRILTDGRPGGEARQYIPWPVRAPVTCACMAIELALKSLITLDGGAPKRVHFTADLFEQLPPASKAELAALLKVGGKPATPETLLQSLREYDDGAPDTQGRRVSPLEAWRYMHDHPTVRHGEDTMLAVTSAIHHVLVRRRPDWRNWPGVIALDE